ncbi:MAG: hypothetical protein AAF434_01200 [Pseudomonadota bacterium]
MPHLVMEHSSNVDVPGDVHHVLRQLHSVLNDVGGILITNCKSRVYQADSFLIADGQSDEGFVHLDISFVRGRSDDVKAQISRDCLSVLKDAFLPINKQPLQITVNVDDIALEMYSKHPAGTLTLQ